jgi:hypothetical protein
MTASRDLTLPRWLGKGGLSKNRIEIESKGTSIFYGDFEYEPKMSSSIGTSFEEPPSPMEFNDHQHRIKL